MATAEFTPLTQPASASLPTEAASEKPLHRIRDVRMEQGMSLRSAARHMNSDVRTLRKQEDQSTDLKLSEVRAWQAALDVPLIDLLEEGDGSLSRPVLERARLVRLMKTAVALRDKAESEGLGRMAEMMVQQLIEVMPELKEVSAWHTYGQRRSLDDLGRIVEQSIPDETMPRSADD